jgi:hypothetical protein
VRGFRRQRPEAKLVGDAQELFRALAALILGADCKTL